MHGLGWIFVAVSTWGILFFTTDIKRFKAFWSAGFWSIGLAMLGEALICSRIDYFAPERLILPVFGTDLLNFFGPRFVEGLLFVQRLQPAGQLKQVAFWVSGVVLGEMGLSFTGHLTLSWNGIGLALAVHSLRFLSLLGIQSALPYGRRRHALLNEEIRNARRESLRKRSQTLWFTVWPVFGVAAVAALRLSRAVNERPLHPLGKPR